MDAAKGCEYYNNNDAQFSKTQIFIYFLALTAFTFMVNSLDQENKLDPETRIIRHDGISPPSRNWLRQQTRTDKRTRPAFSSMFISAVDVAELAGLYCKGKCDKMFPFS